MNIEVGWRMQENDIVSRYREYEAANPLTQHEVRCDAFRRLLSLSLKVDPFSPTFSSRPIFFLLPRE